MEISEDIVGRIEALEAKLARLTLQQEESPIALIYAEPIATTLARELDIPVVALSQVRRESEGKQPNLADLRESGSIEQDADVVIFLHRERLSGDGDEDLPRNVETDLIVAKQRNGPVGSMKIAFIPEYTKFENMTKGADT